MTRNCVYCGKEHDRQRNSPYCSRECLIEHNKEKRHINNIQKEVDGIEGVDYIVCGYCGAKLTQITSTHLNKHHPGKTTEDYKRDFNVQTMFCSKVTVNFGKHMKEESYKQTFSKMFMGESNPNHKSNTTEKERKSRSPKCIEFYQRVYPDKTHEEHLEMLNEQQTRTNDNAIRPTQLQYWVNKGLTPKQAREALKHRQQTKTLETCINKNGAKLGFEIWTARNQKWGDLMKEKYANGEFSKQPNSASVISTDFFTKLINECNFDDSDYYTANMGKSKKEFYRRFKEINKTFAYDFLHRKSKVIIEFQGDMWHGNPRIYKPTDILPLSKMTVKDKWKYDKLKKTSIEAVGYKVIYVWESDYKKDPENEIKKCIKFIYENM